jgi:hypothetical protein
MISCLESLLVWFEGYFIGFRFTNGCRLFHAVGWFPYGVHIINVCTGGGVRHLPFNNLKRERKKKRGGERESIKCLKGNETIANIYE